jgi:fumarate hydratase subunit beta
VGVILFKAMENYQRITSPFEVRTLQALHTGDVVFICGLVYTARDAAHLRLTTALERGEKLPIEIAGQTIYYMGPSPTSPGHIIGAAGPTTSGRMDVYVPTLLNQGLRAMIGKGQRSAKARQLMKQFGAVYFAALGGAGALLSKSVRKVDVVAYDDLGAEAIRRLELVDLPAVVVNDFNGNDLYESGKAAYRLA